jgi:hypothetical protein
MNPETAVEPLREGKVIDLRQGLAAVFGDCEAVPDG